jgi:hypothetical protein
MKKLDIKSGRRFGNLIIVKEIERDCKDKRRFLCLCDCGNYKECNLIHLTYDKTKSCGCLLGKWAKEACGEKNPNWKGGRRIESSGYIEIYNPGHPKARNNRYIKEHRLVMEKSLGRYLTKDESVHHINGNKTDNDISNLELWSSSHPPGQRVADKVKWAKEILNKYRK